MDLPKVRGRVLPMPEGAILVARCPFCGAEHRYRKSNESEVPLEEILNRGFTDEWLPCQYDLPGNFWRIFVGRSRRRRKNGPASGTAPVPSAAEPNGTAPRPARRQPTLAAAPAPASRD